MTPRGGRDWSDPDELRIFAGRNSIPLTERICSHLSMPLGRARTHVFPDGELLVQIDENVRGRDTFVVLSTCEPVNENLMELLIFADSLKRASARRITAVIPYFGYARQDRKDEGRTPITAKLVANLITTAGFDRVLTIDLHAAQIQGFFDLPVDHMTSNAVFAEYLRAKKVKWGPTVVVSPDVGNAKIAELYSQLLEAELAIVVKRRLNGDEVQASAIVGDVGGKHVVMVDDMISTAGTVCAAAKLCREQGATGVTVAATHAVLVPPAIERLQKAPIDEIVLTDTIPSEKRHAPIMDRVTVLSVDQLFGDAIEHIHHNRSVSALFMPGSVVKH